MIPYPVQFTFECLGFNSLLDWNVLEIYFSWDVLALACCLWMSNVLLYDMSCFLHFDACIFFYLINFDTLLLLILFSMLCMLSFKQSSANIGSNRTRIRSTNPRPRRWWRRRWPGPWPISSKLPTRVESYLTGWAYGMSTGYYCCLYSGKWTFFWVCF